MKHPAKFSKPLMPVLAFFVPPDEYGRLLDPFAGTGRIHDLGFLGMVETVGVELEPEWAALHPDTIVGDATNLPEGWAGTFDAVVTSPTYGNRMADHHEAKDPCKPCAGRGCVKCDYRGLSRRNTYKHVLGRNLSPNSSAAMQWGPEYRAFHELAWKEAWRVLRPGGRLVINIKDHIRDKQRQRVTAWHLRCCVGIGFTLAGRERVPLRGNRMGENGTARVPHEWVLAFDKPASLLPQGVPGVTEEKE